MKIGWIGVGRMGAPMAARLLGRLPGLDLEPHPRQGRDRGTEGREGCRGSSRARGRRCSLHDAVDWSGRHRRVLRSGRHVPRGREEVPSARWSIARRSAWTSLQKSAPAWTSVGVQFLAAPVSGNPKCVRAGKLSCVVSGPTGGLRSRSSLLLLAIAAAWGRICRRRRAGANVQDCGQSPARCRQREHDGGHVARPKGGRSSTCLS